MEPVIGKNERSEENLVHKQRCKRKRSNNDATNDMPMDAIGKDEFSSTTMGQPQCRFHGSNPNTNRITKKEITHNCLSEEELVALWVGVRRYGAGNWDAILGDPFLNCLKRKPKRIYPRGGTISYA